VGASVDVVKKPQAVIVEDEEVPRLAPRRRWRAALAALAVIVVGGMAIALVQNISPSSPSQVNAAPADREMAPVVEPAVPVPTPRERATTVLRELMGSPSPRIARAAAIGLARTCDEAAKTHLTEASKTETSEIAALENAYVLARCGDGIARQALVHSLKSSRRDVKADAARHLVTLGDDTGLSFLHALLNVSQHRLGAAEALARKKDPKAVAALSAIHGAAGTEPDDKLRAAIALGLAGDASVTEELRAALADPRFRPAAAAALAELGDTSARDALVDGLGVPSLRVAAALALRRLSPDLDAAPLVAPLIDALATERDNSQVSAAEALLVLTGPRADAEKP
jgi:HEAT repeat protein